MRRVATSSEFFDILDKIGNGKFVTIGYVSGANLDVPKVKKVNPLTNRMKGYPDYSVFGEEEEIGALVKITSYNMRYLNRTSVSQKYGEYKNAANDIRSNFGLDPIGNKESYKQGTNWSPNGPELYKGNNTDLQSHSYNPQNIYGVKPKSIVYAVNKEGHIIKALSEEQVKPYLAKKREIDGVAALRKMEVEDERIQDYINKINDLKFKYINFESNSILWIAATINGEKIVYINDNLNRAVDEINIKPEDFRAIARERYQIDLNDLREMRMKSNINKIRLTESELKTRLKESIQKVLSELDWRTAHSAKEKATRLAQDAKDARRHMEAERRKNQANTFDQYSYDTFNKDYWHDRVKKKREDFMAKNPLASQGDYKPTQGELKRMQQGEDDSYNFLRGKQEYKDGKWQNKTDESKQPMKITSETLRNLVKESAMNILSELDWRTYASAAKKGDEWRKSHPKHRANQWNRVYGFDNAATDSFNKEHDLENQYDNGAHGGEVGTMNLRSHNGNIDFSGSRDHDFGDGDPHGLGHNVYHMSKEYGKDGGYGRTRMWDRAHETTPEEFYGDEEMGKKFRNAEKEVEDFKSGKTKYTKGKGWSNESKEGKLNIQERAFKNNQGYSHFAVSKKNGKIVNGWDYKQYDPSELRQFKKDYFDNDLIDYGFNPKDFRILTYKYLVRNGINPDENSNWSNTDETNAEIVG